MKEKNATEKKKNATEKKQNATKKKKNATRKKNVNITIRNKKYDVIWSEPPLVEVSYQFNTPITEAEGWSDDEVIFRTPVKLNLILLPHPNDDDGYEGEFIEVSGRRKDILRDLFFFYKRNGPQTHEGISGLRKIDVRTYQGAFCTWKECIEETII